MLSGPECEAGKSVGRIERFVRAVFGGLFGRNSVEALRRRGLVAGANLSVMRGAFIDPSHAWLIHIGDDVTLARNAMILAHDASTKIHLGYTRIGVVRIGDRVFIGAGAIVLPGVRIGNDVVIGAGSVVSRDIPDDTVALGVPARPVAKTSEWIEARRAEMAEVPCFGREYTEQGGATSAQRAEMMARLEGGHGYIA